jgi:polyisoprenoid-binding protein YceI
MIRASNIRVAAVLLMGALAGSCPAEQYIFDSKSTVVRFTYQAGFTAQSARFTQLSGHFEFDKGVPSRNHMDAVIKTASLTTNTFQDVLKGSDFFDVKAWPEIRFRSLSFQPIGDNKASLTGDLTIRGVTRSVTFQTIFDGVSLPDGHHNAENAAGPIRFTARTKISRSSFNMTALWLLVDDEINIELKAALSPAREQ